MPAAGAGAAVADVPTGATGATPASVAVAAAVVLVGGAVTACWAGGTAGPTEGAASVTVPTASFPPPSPLGH